MTRFKPATCPHCEYDRRFPGFEAGGWIQQDNNGPVVSCPLCNDDGSHPPGGVEVISQRRSQIGGVAVSITFGRISRIQK